MSELKEEIVDGMVDVLNTLLDGAEGDLRAYANAIGEDIVRMIEGGEVDPNLMDEWGEQLQLVAEANRLRVSAEVTAQIQKIAIMAVRVGVAAAMG